ncbi:hypothetical protein AGMMS50284_1250 [Clostridia bacterium]|nr:hypothetical protein AGMMS50284_1250 [Clostridia bacterium]
MKTSKIVAIICWSLVSLLFVSVLVTGILGGSVFGSFSFEEFANWGNSDNFTVSKEYSVPVGNIDSIDVGWTSGYVDIKPYDGKEIIFTEKSKKELKDKDRLTYNTGSGGKTLTIKFREHPLSFQFFSFGGGVSKGLEVWIPKELSEKLSTLKINCVSADLTVSDVNAVNEDLTTVSGDISLEKITGDKIKLSSTSGDVKLKNVTAKNTFNVHTVSGEIDGDAETSSLNTDTVSGDTNVTGKFSEITAHSVSGYCIFESSVCPRTVEIETVSGDATLKIPENDGFDANFSTVSGDLNCNFAALVEKKHVLYKTGVNKFNFHSVSGDVFVKESKK